MKSGQATLCIDFIAMYNSNKYVSLVYNLEMQHAIIAFASDTFHCYYYKIVYFDGQSCLYT